jgi:hypothetical protein
MDASIRCARTSSATTRSRANQSASRSEPRPRMRQPQILHDASASRATVNRVSDVGVIWARAPSLEKLERELARLLAGRAAGDILGISHSSCAMSSKQSGVSGAGQAKHTSSSTPPICCCGALCVWTRRALRGAIDNRRDSGSTGPSSVEIESPAPSTERPAAAATCVRGSDAFASDAFAVQRSSA